ncbi:MAG: LysR substrate-binding domain-containing protein, partial [Alphaproteobacteria bacterium]|nr:LysR substrate-binding domain-containing protein [Alphaproteobacteria bacterium]
MALNFNQLSVFCEIMRTGSVSAAARSLSRTQPTVSAMLANLEEQLGFELFTRIKGRLTPTPEAHYMFEEAKQILDQLGRCENTMREIGGLQKGHLRVACLPAASNNLMPRIISNFVKDKPAVNVSLLMRSSVIIEEWVASQQYEIGFAETPTPRGSIHIQSFDMNAVCAIPEDDPLARNKTISPHDLRDKPMANLTPGHHTRENTLKAFAKHRIPYHQRFELQTFQPALEFVEQGLCYCICDTLTAANYNLNKGDIRRLVFRPFEPVVSFSTAILTPAHKPISALGQAFVSYLIDQIRDIETLALAPEKS